MTKTCKICKNKFEPKRSTLEPTCDNYDCKVSYALIQVKKQKDKQAKEQKSKNKKEYNDKFKKLSEYEAEAKKAFQKWIRLRDAEQPCISCGEYEKDLWDGGHYKKAEIYSGVIFNENNCFKQCRRCNRYLNGNELMYRQGLIKRFGAEFADNIEKLANETRSYKYTKFELIEKKKEYDLKIKQFTK